MTPARKELLIVEALVVVALAVILAGAIGYCSGRDSGKNNVLVQQATAKADALTHELVPLKKSRAKTRPSFAAADSAYHENPDSAHAAVTIANAETTIALDDTVIAKMDTLIRTKDKLLELRAPKPNRIIPYIAIEYDVDSAAWSPRVGVELRVSHLRIGPAVERRGTVTRLLVAGRWEFR